MGNCPLSPHRPPLRANITDLRNQVYLDHHLPSRAKSKSGEAAASIVGRVDHPVLRGDQHMGRVSVQLFFVIRAARQTKLN